MPNLIEGNMSSIMKDQAALIARTSSGSMPIIAFRGDAIKEEIDAAGWDLDDVHDVKPLPTEPGLFVWEGEIRYVGFYGYDDDGDVLWRGTLRPATWADVIAFGMDVWHNQEASRG